MTFPQEILLWIPEELGLLPLVPSPELEFPPRRLIPLVATCGTPGATPGHPPQQRAPICSQGGSS